MIVHEKHVHEIIGSVTVAQDFIAGCVSHDLTSWKDDFRLKQRHIDRLVTSRNRSEISGMDFESYATRK